MGLSHDVNLPIDHTPIWPPGCVTCGGPEGDRPFLLKPIGAQWHRALMGAPGKSASVVHVACCLKCRRQIRSAKISRGVLKWAAVLPLIVVAITLTNILGITGALRPFVLITIGFGLMIPVHLFLMFACPAENIDIVRRSKDLSYQFRDPLIAREFAELNDAVVA